MFNVGIALVICASANGDCCLVNEHQDFTPGTANANDQFGYSMSMSGERLVVGARFGDILSIPVSTCGVAWIWTLGSDGLWANEVRIDAATDAATNDSFGWSVGMDDDLVIAGSPFDTHSSQTNAGSAYVFVDSSGWSQEQKLIASDAAPSDNFG
jgi:hypothetical protein